MAPDSGQSHILDAQFERMQVFPLNLPSDALALWAPPSGHTIGERVADV